MEISMFLGPLMGNSPGLVFWTAVIIIAAVMLRRGGGRGERFLMAGAVIKLTGNLLGMPVALIPIWLRSRGYSMDSAVSIASNCSILLSVIGMLGIICLLYAFWIKFQEKNSEGQVALLQD